MQNNMRVPFKVGRPVEREYFIDRKEEIAEIRALMTSLSNACLLGLRRMGKTSLLRAAMAGVHDPIPVYVNCYGIPEMKRFASILTDAVREAYIEATGDKMYASGIQKYLGERVERLAYYLTEMEISLGHYFRVKIGTLGREIEAGEVLEDAFRYPEVLGQSRSVRFVLMLDEFQDIGSRWGEDFIKRLRSIAEGQERVAYLFCGSSITFMSSLIEERSSPFYRQLQRINVGPLPEEEVRGFVAERFRICGYTVDKEALPLFVSLTNRIPDYVQRLGALAARLSHHIDEKVVRRAYEEMFTELDSEFRETLALLNQRSGTYGAILSGLSLEESLSAAGRAVGHDFGGSTRQISYLQSIGLVRKVSRGRYQIADPIFREWLRRNMV